MEPYEGGVPKNTLHGPSRRPERLALAFRTFRAKCVRNNDTPSTGGYFDPTFQERVTSSSPNWAKHGTTTRVAYVEMESSVNGANIMIPINLTTYWKPHTQSYHVANRT